MGSDGAERLLEIKNAGGYTIVESKETATLFGMPKAAIQLGVQCEILPLDQIPQRLVEVLGQQRPQPSPASKAQLVRWTSFCFREAGLIFLANFRSFKYIDSYTDTLDR